ncbi:hypothetical protein RhiTH_010045 [Rhizoctonia solani]
MEPALLPTPNVDNYNVGEVSLERGVQGQLDCLKQKFGKQAKAIKETQSIVEGVSQTVNGLKARVPQNPQPSTPKDQKIPPPVEETP